MPVLKLKDPIEIVGALDKFNYIADEEFLRLFDKPSEAFVGRPRIVVKRKSLSYYPNCWIQNLFACNAMKV
jgi:hypothetical protein